MLGGPPPATSNLVPVSPEEAAMLGDPPSPGLVPVSAEENAMLGPGGVGRPQGFLSAFSSGVKRGAYNEMGNLKAATGLAVYPFDNAEGDGIIENAIKLQRRGAQQNPRGIEKLEDIDEWGDLPIYLGDTLGEGFVSIGSTLATGGVTGAVAKTAVKSAVKQSVKKLASYAPEAGMLTHSIASESGATAAELKEATGKVEWLTSVGAGIAKGALESLTPMVIGKAVGIGADDQIKIVAKVAALLKGSTMKRVLSGAATTAALEGATEGSQEVIDLLARTVSDKDYQFFSTESGSRVLNAVVAGALTGAPVGGAVAGLTGRTAKEEVIPETELPASGVDPITKEKGIDLNQEIKPIEAALTAEEKYVAEAALTLGDLANGATPGSKPEHAVLGFQALPDGFRGISARTSRDALKAPLEIVARDLEGIRQNLVEASKDADLDEVTKSKVKRQAEDASNTLGYLLSAAMYRDSAGVPTSEITANDAEPLATTPMELEAANEDLLPNGFKVALYNGPERLQLQRMDGSPVINVPNDINYRGLLAHVMKADRLLVNSGFYKAAKFNENRLITMQGDGIDLSYAKTLDNKLDRANYYRKALDIASPLDALPKAARPQHGQAAIELEAGHVKFNQMMRNGYTVLQWAQRNPELTPLQNYVDILQVEKGATMKILSRSDGLLKRFMRLGKDQQDAAHDYLEALDKMAYLREDEVQMVDRRLPDGSTEKVSRRVPRMPTPDEDRQLIKGLRYRKNKTPLLRETYAVVKEMQTMQDDLFREYINFASEEARIRFHKPKELVQRLAALQKMIDSYFVKPRFPFTSIGEFVVTATSKEGKLVEALQSETPGDQKRDFASLIAKYGDKEGYEVRQSRIPQEVAKYTSLPSMVIRDLSAKGFMQKVTKEHRELLLYLADIGPQNKKRFITGMSPKKRSIELQRAFALWSQNVANAFFEMKAGPALEREIQTLKKGLGKAPNTNKLGLLVQALSEHMDFLMNPPADWTGMKNFAFMFHIAFNAKSAIMNATQVPMVTLPYLSGRFGDFKAVRALQKAYMDKRTLYSKEATAELTDQMSRLLTKAIEDGKVDESFATEQASLAEGTNLNRMLAGSKYDRFMKEVSYYGSYLFAAVEKTSRSVAFRATVQLALDNPNSKYLQDIARQQPRAMAELARQGFSEEESRAYIAGVDTINQTMFEYAKWNRPKFMRGGAKGALFTFWMFTQGMLHFAIHSPGAVRYWLTMMAVAGLMGMPGADDLNELIHAISQRLFGKDFSPKREARLLITTMIDPFIRENFNPAHRTAADLILHGISKNSFGLSAAADAMGIPWIPDLDLSQSLGMGRILPIGPELLKPGVDYTRALAETTQRVSGAAFGPLFAVVEALRSEDADFKRWEKAMPSALRGFLKAGRYQQEERERGLKGDTVVDFDPHDPADQAEIIAVSLGFTPTRVSQKWDQVIELRDATNYWNYRKSILLRQLDYATMMKDQEGRVDVMSAIKRYNGQLPEYMRTKRITSESIKNSLRERARLRALANSGLPGAKSDRPAAKYFKELYNEPVP